MPSLPRLSSSPRPSSPASRSSAPRPGFGLVLGLFHPQAVGQPQPGAEGALAFLKLDDAGAPREALAPVGREAAGPTVTQADPVQLALEVVDVVVAGESAHHV